MDKLNEILEKEFISLNFIEENKFFYKYLLHEKKYLYIFKNRSIELYVKFLFEEINFQIITTEKDMISYFLLDFKNYNALSSFFDKIGEKLEKWLYSLPIYFPSEVLNTNNVFYNSLEDKFIIDPFFLDLSSSFQKNDSLNLKSQKPITQYNTSNFEKLYFDSLIKEAYSKQIFSWLSDKDSNILIIKGNSFLAKEMLINSFFIEYPEFYENTCFLSKKEFYQANFDFESIINSYNLLIINDFSYFDIITHLKKITNNTKVIILSDSQQDNKLFYNDNFREIDISQKKSLEILNTYYLIAQRNNITENIKDIFTNQAILKDIISVIQSKFNSLNSIEEELLFVLSVIQKIDLLDFFDIFQKEEYIPILKKLENDFLISIRNRKILFLKLPYISNFSEKTKKKFYKTY